MSRGMWSTTEITFNIHVGTVCDNSKSVLYICYVSVCVSLCFEIVWNEDMNLKHGNLLWVQQHQELLPHQKLPGQRKNTDLFLVLKDF